MQDDTRYAEAYVRSRVVKGYGPVRILNELLARGLTGERADHALAAMEPDWDEQIRAVRQKKFGEQAPTDMQEQARQSRFLHYRGFTSEQIRNTFRQTY